jgi:hypothetical protein
VGNSKIENRQSQFGNGKLPRLCLGSLPVPKVFAQPLIDEGSDAGVSLPGVLSNGVGYLRLQINGNIQFGIRAEKLPALTLGKIILFLHDWVSSYCLVSRLSALRAGQAGNFVWFPFREAI